VIRAREIRKDFWCGNLLEIFHLDKREGYGSIILKQFLDR
jgi:hypothetical protein